METHHRVVVAGGGNICHAISGMLASSGHKVTVLTRRPSDWKKEIRVNYMGETREGQLEDVVSSAQYLHGHYDVCIITCPLYAFGPIAERVSLFGEEIPVIAVPGRLFDDQIQGTLLKSYPRCLVSRTPYISRVTQYGSSVDISGIAHKGLGCCYDPSFPEHLLTELFLMPIRRIQSEESINLCNSNSILHTSRLYELFVHNDYRYPVNPMFYCEWGDEASNTLLQCDLELQSLIAVMREQGVQVRVTSIEEHYCVKGAKELTLKLRSIPAFTGMLAPTVMDEQGLYIPDVTSRYFTEDMVGLAYIVDKCKEYGVPCPRMEGLLSALRELTEKFRPK